MKHFLALFRARNREFYRDRDSMAWTLLFPFVLIIGIGYKLVPMFLISEIQNPRRAWASLWVVNLGLAASAITRRQGEVVDTGVAVIRPVRQGQAIRVERDAAMQGRDDDERQRVAVDDERFGVMERGGHGGRVREARPGW